MRFQAVSRNLTKCYTDVFISRNLCVQGTFVFLLAAETCILGNKICPQVVSCILQERYEDPEDASANSMFILIEENVTGILNYVLHQCIV